MPTQYKCRTEAAAASLDTFLGIMETGLYNQRRASPAASSQHLGSVLQIHNPNISVSLNFQTSYYSTIPVSEDIYQTPILVDIYI